MQIFLNQIHINTFCFFIFSFARFQGISIGNVRLEVDVEDLKSKYPAVIHLTQQVVQKYFIRMLQVQTNLNNCMIRRF